MKKVFYALCTVSAIASLTLSCVKESSPIEENTDNKTSVADGIPTEIVAVINPEDAQTKTQYAGNTTFGWTHVSNSERDEVRMPVKNGSNQWNFYTFHVDDDTEDGLASVTFIRNNSSTDDLDTYTPSGWTNMGYILYPYTIYNFSGSTEDGVWNSGTKPIAQLPNSIAYNSSKPLDGGVVPLIGRMDGEHYKFSTAVGIIKLTVSNAPSAGNKIKLVSTDKPIAGKFAISDVDATVSQIANTSATAGTNELTLTGLSLTDGETYDFYFPLPVGTYDKGTLKLLVMKNESVLLEQNVGKALNIERNCVLSVPTLPYHRVYVDGSLSAPVLHTVKPSTANTIRVCVSTERLTAANYSKSNWNGDNRFGSSTSYNILSLGGPGGGSVLTSESDYYLQYIVCSTATQPDALSDGNVMVYGSVPFHYIPSTRKIPVASSWLDVPYISTSEGKDKANLVDGNTSTYWHSPYGKEDPARNATYGQIISIDLNEGSLTTNGNFYFYFYTRNTGTTANHAKSMNIYVSNVPWDDAGFDAGKVLVGSTENALEGINPSGGAWIKNPINCSGTGSYRYITVSILSNSSGNDLRTTGCTHMAEIEFYTK